MGRLFSLQGLFPCVATIQRNVERCLAQAAPGVRPVALASPLVATSRLGGASWAYKQQTQLTTIGRHSATVRCNSSESGGSPEAESDVPKAPRRQQQVEKLSMTREGMMELQEQTHVRRYRELYSGLPSCLKN